MTAGVKKQPFRVVYISLSMAQEGRWILAHNSERMTASMICSPIAGQKCRPSAENSSALRLLVRTT